MSDESLVHILDGDETGGGHRYGEGKPCKSEFPVSWSDQKIFESIQKIAANDNLSWKKQDNSYYVAEQNNNGVRIRVVIDRKNGDVVTAYPVNLGRNPCPPFSKGNRK